MRREPIVTPFLLKENETEFQLAVRMFKLVLRFMNESLTPEQEILLGNYILHVAIRNFSLRDEIYVQLVNQTHQNPSVANSERGWILMAAASCCIVPSSTLYKPLLK